MNRRQKIIVSVTGIFLVLLILVGLTYAYFLTQIQGNEEEKSITVTTANLVLEYGDGNGVIEIDRLEPSNNFITFRDKEGNEVPSKTFTVTNKGNATVEGYKVYLEHVQNQLVRKDDFVYTLSCKAYSNYGETNQTELETGCNGVETETTFPDVITSIVTNDIAVGITHFYELKLKYKEMNTDQSIDMNKLITAKVNIYGNETKFLAREMIDNQTNTIYKTEDLGTSLASGTTVPGKAMSGVGSYKEATNYSTHTLDLTNLANVDITNWYWTYGSNHSFDSTTGIYTLTDRTTTDVPFKDISDKSILVGKYLMGLYANAIGAPTKVEAQNLTVTSNLGSIKITAITDTTMTLEFRVPETVVASEAVMAKTVDNFGTTYYYRGSVENNYVNFAGMCWRIVRINGDGSTKLILEDKQYLCDSGSRQDQGWSLSAENEQNVSYGYEKVTASDGSEIYVGNYVNPTEDKEKSLVNVFKKFQNDKLKDYEEYLAPGNWCINDQVIYGDKAGTTLLDINQKDTLYKNKTDFYYDTYVRTNDVETAAPTLKCSGTIINKYIDNTNMYVGTLTTDEVVFAGGIVSTSMGNGYLQPKNSGQTAYYVWWALSPYSFRADGLERAYRVIYGNLGGSYVNASESGNFRARPAINIKGDVDLTEGTGTISDPYVIG